MTVLILVKTVYKGCQQTTEVADSKEIVGTNASNMPVEHDIINLNVSINMSNMLFTNVTNTYNQL